jgi:hypothetical protein
MMDTMGFALLLEALNEPCECESATTILPHQYRAIPGKSATRAGIARCIVCRLPKDCHVPLHRWWSEKPPIVTIPMEAA